MRFSVSHSFSSAAPASAVSPRTLRSALLFVALTASAATAACSSADSPAGNGTTPPVTGDGALVDGGVILPQAPDIRASALDADLKAAGLDPANLPEFDALIASFEGGGPDAAKPVMTLFATSLGLECKGCHSGAKNAVPTARRNIVAGMWNKFVREMRLKQGGLLFCDSCHQGKATFLVREDPKGLGAWMSTNFANGLVSATGAANTCTTCHGDPFNGPFLDVWAATK